MKKIIQIFILTLLIAGKSFSAEALTYQSINTDQETAIYSKEFFTLVENKPYILDKKNYYNQAIANEFDYLTQTISKETNIDKNIIKKRLLSGPASRAKLISINGSKTAYYNICQAHACNIYNAAILVNIETRKLLSIVKWDSKTITYGNPSENEIVLIKELTQDNE